MVFMFGRRVQWEQAQPQKSFRIHRKMPLIDAETVLPIVSRHPRDSDTCEHSIMFELNFLKLFTENLRICEKLWSCQTMKTTCWLGFQQVNFHKIDKRKPRVWSNSYLCQGACLSETKATGNLIAGWSLFPAASSRKNVMFPFSLQQWCAVHIETTIDILSATSRIQVFHRDDEAEEKPTSDGFLCFPGSERSL